MKKEKKEKKDNFLLIWIKSLYVSIILFFVFVYRSYDLSLNIHYMANEKYQSR